MFWIAPSEKDTANAEELEPLNLAARELETMIARNVAEIMEK